MKQYLELLNDVLKNGVKTEDRTGVGTLSVFGRQIRYNNIEENFPLLTTKKLHFKSIVGELLWFISGSKSKEFLIRNKISIWDEWSLSDGKNSVGEMYGYLWRNWKDREGNSIDQLQNVINELKTNPDSRRLIVSAWNPDSMKMNKQALACCHNFFQFKSYKVNDHRELSIMVNIRSNDLFLGHPYNVTSYALLLMMIAQLTNHKAKDVVINIGDAHIYLNHIEQVKEQIKRTPLVPPKIFLNKQNNINDYTFQDIVLEDYKAHPHIKGDVAI